MINSFKFSNFARKYAFIVKNKRIKCKEKK